MEPKHALKLPAENQHVTKLPGRTSCSIWKFCTKIHNDFKLCKSNPHLIKLPIRFDKNPQSVETINYLWT